jgi:hypothetical protein
MGLDLNVQLEKIDRVLQTMVMAPSKSYLGMNLFQLVHKYPVRFLISTDLTFFNGKNTAYICYDHRTPEISLCLKTGPTVYKAFDCLSDHLTRTRFVMDCQSILDVRNETISCSATPQNNGMLITIVDNRIRAPHSLLFSKPE